VFYTTFLVLFYVLIPQEVTSKKQPAMSLSNGPKNGQKSAQKTSKKAPALFVSAYSS
jgi:hypothetical protein